MIDKNTIYSYFQTDDFPTEDQFRATWDSFWHKSESIPMSSITGLNQLFQQTATVAQLNGKANVDGSNINVSAYQEKLNITNLIATAKEEVKTELLNGAPEAFDTLKEISDWISDDGTAEAAILQAIQNEATARTNADNQKLDKGSYVGTAQDLYNYFEGKIDAGYNCIPVVGNGASGKVLVDSAVSEIYGKIGINLSGEASEKLEVNGNIKAIDFKGQSIKFNLQPTITPTPNTLVPKTDGNRLIWYNSSSVPFYTALFGEFFEHGYGAGNINNNVVLGETAFISNTTGRDSVAIGSNALNQMTTQIGNTAIGSNSLTSLGINNGQPNRFSVSSNYNVAIGESSMRFTKEGINNVVIGGMNEPGGFTDGSVLSSVKNNVSIGTSSMNNATTAIMNTVIGAAAACYITSGMGNIVIGYRAGLALKTGVNNLFIGNGAGGHTVSTPDVSDKLCIENRRHNVNNNSYWENSISPYLTDYKKGLISGDFNVREINIDGKFSITPSRMPTTDSTYTKRVLLNPTSGVFAWEDNDRIKLPNYTKSQRDNLPNKMTGDVIWQTDSGNSGIRVYNGTNWLAVQTTID